MSSIYSYLLFTLCFYRTFRRFRIHHFAFSIVTNSLFTQVFIFGRIVYNVQYVPLQPFLPCSFSTVSFGWLSPIFLGLYTQVDMFPT